MNTTPNHIAFTHTCDDCGAVYSAKREVDIFNTCVHYFPAASIRH